MWNLLHATGFAVQQKAYLFACKIGFQLQMICYCSFSCKIAKGPLSNLLVGTMCHRYCDDNCQKKKTKKARLLLQLREQIFWTFSGNFKTLCKWVVNFNNVYILNFGGTFKLKAERSIILLLNLSITIRQTMKPLVAAATKALCYPTCSCNLFTPNSCRTTWKAFFH